GLCTLVAML
nr:Chain P, 9-meric peptide from mRNA export factor EB2 [human gammaherpesvirus 4]3O4L_C Chain C, BSLF2/BMLF1 protein [human gammaherpesvirus 4]